MNNTIKTILIFTAGVGIGAAGATYIIRDGYARLANEEIASVRETLVARKYPEREIDENGMPYKRYPDEEKVLVLRRDQHKKIIRQYNGLGDANVEHPLDDGEEYDKYEEISVAANHESGDGPHVISLEEFSEEMMQYDKLTISYYEVDDTLADDGEEIIANSADIVGEEALESFGMLSDDPDIVYVRNDRIATDYEIVRLPKSYSETVLGYKQVPDRGQRARMGGFVEE